MSAFLTGRQERLPHWGKASPRYNELRHDIEQFLKILKISHFLIWTGSSR